MPVIKIDKIFGKVDIPSRKKRKKNIPRTYEKLNYKIS